MNQRDDDPTKPTPAPGRPGLFQMVCSVLAAAFGVQSSRNRQRDFTQGRAKAFIIMGITFTVLFVASVYTIVRLILNQAGN